MKHLILLVVTISLLMTACNTSIAPTEPSTQPEANVMTDPQLTIHPDRENCSVPTASKECLLTYKVIGNRKLRLYFLPPLQQVYEKAPIIFMFPGGGLMACDMMSPYAIYATELDAIRNAGFATVTIDYRIGGANGEGVTPHEIVSDCMDAMRYISYYSEILGVDPQKIVTTGHSAGGMLSLLTAYAPHDFFDADGYWPEADFGVVGAFALSAHGIYYKGDGPYDGYYSRTSPDTSLWSTEELRQLCTTTNYVKNGGVPCTILIGTHDEWVAPEGIALFEAACEEGGVECRVVWFQNADHGFASANGQPVTPDYNATRATITSFATECVQNAG